MTTPTSQPERTNRNVKIMYSNLYVIHDTSTYMVFEDEKHDAINNFAQKSSGNFKTRRPINHSILYKEGSFQ